MDGWLKKADGWFEQVSGFQQTLLQRYDGTSARDVEFEDGTLGFQMEGSYVVFVEPESQACRLGIQVGDMLTRVAGYDVPCSKKGNFELEKRANKLIRIDPFLLSSRKWIKEAPRPVRLTFKPAELLNEADTAAELVGDEASSESAVPDSLAEVFVAQPATSLVVGESMGFVHHHLDDSHQNVAALEVAEEPEVAKFARETDCVGHINEVANSSSETDGRSLPAVAELQALLDETMEQCKRFDAELQQEKREHAKVRAALDAEKRKSAIYHKKAIDMEESVGTLRAQSEQLVSASVGGKVASKAALESSEARVVFLEVENARMRMQASNAEASLKLAEEKIEQLLAEASKAAENHELAEQKGRTAMELVASSEQQLHEFKRTLKGINDAHDAELELQREEHARQQERQWHVLREKERVHAEMESASEQRLAAMAKQVEQAQRLAEERQIVAENASVEAAAAVVEAASSRAAAKAVNVGDVEAGQREDCSALHEHISQLERRIVTLQDRIRTQGSSPVAVDTGSAFEHWITAAVGLRVAGWAVVPYNFLDGGLRNFTKKLLDRGTWLWVFYAHLVVLYAIAGSCSAQTYDARNPVESINQAIQGVSAGG